MTILLLLSSSLILLPSLVFLYKAWLKPICLQKMLCSQGLKGPPSSFIHGNTREIVKMKKLAIASSMDLSQHDLFPRILPHVDLWMKAYGNNFVIWIGHQPQIVVTEPELVKEVLTNKNGVYHKLQPTVYIKRCLGNGLLVAEGEKWSRRRKLANRSFHGECLKDMFQEMVASSEIMLEKWRYLTGKEIEASKEFKTLTSEVISRTAFGSSYQEGKNIFETLSKLAEVATGNVYTVRLFGNMFRSKVDIESDQIEQSLRESIMILIRKREAKVKSGEKDNFGSDFLASLLEVHHDKDPSNRISIEDIIDECKVFYLAGHETTSNLLSWTVLLLSVYTDWQEKAREEVLQLLGQENPTTDSIAKLKILTMIINEALRLYGPAVSVTRRAHCKTRLGRYEIPANVQVNVPILGLHRNSDIWGQDAHVFDPERFSEGLAKATKGNTTAYLPFGFGPRMCVGVNFATNEVKISLSMILQRYKFTLSPNYVHSPAQITTINPQHGIQIILHNL